MGESTLPGGRRRRDAPKRGGVNREGRDGEAREDRSSDTSLAYTPVAAIPQRYGN